MTTRAINRNQASNSAAGEMHHYASPPCYRHEIDPSYNGFLDKAELVGLLNELLEGERAGARGLREMTDDTVDRDLKGILAAVAKDEADFSAMLTRHIIRLGKTPGRTVGRFCSRLRTRVSIAEKMALLARAQSAVVRTLTDWIPRIEDQELHADLKNMRDVHVRNIERCADISAGRNA